MPRLKPRIIEMAVILLWGLACWIFFQFFYQYHFFYQEQNQLFLHTSDYLATYFQKPGWLACMTGDFLTQLYYYRFAGPVVLTFTLLVMGDLLRRAFGRIGKGAWGFWAAIALMTLEAIFFLHYSHRLSSALAVILGTLLFLVYTTTSRMHAIAKVVIGLGLGLIAYRTAGYGWMVYALLATAYGLVRKSTARWWAPVFAALVIIAAPTLTNRHYLLNTAANLTYPGIGRPCLPETELETTLAINNEYYFGQWSKVEKMVEDEPAPNELMLFFYNLVKAQKGELPDHLLRYVPNQLGSFYKIGPDIPLPIINNMNELYWVLGDMTLTERAAMMTNVFAPNNRNVRMVKRLAECNIVSGDTLAANKYLRILDHTLAYREWAGNARKGVGIEELNRKKAFVNHEDTIRVTDNLHMVMMELLDTNPDNVVALDYILCSTLLLKDIESFKRDYDRYCIATGKARVKPLYQQALMIWLAGSNASEEEWKKYITDQEQLHRFNEYSQHRGDPRFNDTYWYYFDTAKAPEI